jgi:sulfur carrier protein ThiS
MGAVRRELGIGPPGGVVAIDGKALRRGYEKGRAFMPPLMVSVWDAETRLSIAAARAPGGSETTAALALLKSLNLAEESVVFEPNVETHHHFIDDRTGAIHDIPWDMVQVCSIDRLRGYEIRDYQVVLHGRRK